MSNVPYLLSQARQGYHIGHGEVTDAMLHDGLRDVYSSKHMGALADMCTVKYGITRSEQDEWAIQSYERAIYAWHEGWFRDELVEVEVMSRTGASRVSRDERLQKFDEAKLRRLPPLFQNDGHRDGREYMRYV